MNDIQIYVPQNLTQLMDYAKIIADSDLAPKDFKGKPGNVLVAIQMGAEVGLKPLQALQNIAVINGRPTMWGDAVLALIKPHCEWIREEKINGVATCSIKRRGDEEVKRSFSMDEAKRAGLLSKQGPWQTYPDRMLQMRARGFAARDAFADILKGIIIREEAEDYTTKEKVINPEIEKAKKIVNADTGEITDIKVPIFIEEKKIEEPIINECKYIEQNIKENTNDALNIVTEELFVSIKEGLQRCKTIDELQLLGNDIKKLDWLPEQRNELAKLYKTRSILIKNSGDNNG